MKEISETDIHTIFDDFKRRRRYNLAKAILDYLMKSVHRKGPVRASGCVPLLQVNQNVSYLFKRKLQVVDTIEVQNLHHC